MRFRFSKAKSKSLRKNPRRRIGFEEAKEIFEHPHHPYTRGLMSAFPAVRGPRRELLGIPGSPPDLAHPPAGCPFHPRCPEVMPVCRRKEPELYPVGDAEARCFLYAGRAKEAV